MKLIRLTKGKFAKVDDVDFESLNHFRWYALKGKWGFYAARDAWIKGAGRATKILMHRKIIGANPKEKVDHRDHDGLNNQKGNLRIATNSQNNFNSRLSKANTSGFKGVCWDKFVGQWFVTIKVNKRSKSIGHFKDPVKAARAYDRESLKHHGEFACTNESLGLLPAR